MDQAIRIKCPIDTDTTYRSFRKLRRMATSYCGGTVDAMEASTGSERGNNVLATSVAVAQGAANDDEQQLLESMAASVQPLDVYESSVLRQATHAMVPWLADSLYFPPLESILPVTDAAILHSVLQQVRQRSDDASYLQEQVLLTLLARRHAELPIRGEAQREERRRRRETESESNNNKQADPAPTTAEPVVTTSQPPRRTRISIMERRRQQSANEPPPPEVMERRQQLMQLRLERRRRKEERRRQRLTDDESEHEFEMSTQQQEQQQPDNEKATCLEEHVPDNAICIDHDDNEDPDVPPSRDNLVTCPLCGDQVTATDHDALDAMLAQHMDQCQRQRPKRRQSRGGSAVASPPHGSAAPTLPTPKKAKAVVVAEPKTRRASKSVVLPEAEEEELLSAPAALDDLEEWCYEDRVDDWVANGLTSMKVMKERDATEQEPGDEEWENHVWVPAWINNRLFDYQREGIRTMYRWYQQGAGGIVGDQMGLGKTGTSCSCAGSV
jgi:hypothetical protein